MMALRTEVQPYWVNFLEMLILDFHMLVGFEGWLQSSNEANVVNKEVRKSTWNNKHYLY